MPLTGPGNVSRSEVCDAASVDFAGPDVSSGDEVVEPGCGERIVFVVERIHRCSSS
jgi:hypothetical protein